MRRWLVVMLCGLIGLAGGCGSGKNHPKPAGTVPPPQPTTGKTGTPSGPTNTARTTTSTSK